MLRAELARLLFDEAPCDAFRPDENPADVARMESALSLGGYEAFYGEALYQAVSGLALYEEWPQATDFWAVATAPASVRARAALVAIRRGDEVLRATNSYSLPRIPPA